MRVMQRGISIILPGKMAEAMELSKQLVAILDRVGFPPFKIYQPYAGGADVMHTLVFEGEWDSFTTLGTLGDKVLIDPELQALAPKLAAVRESHRVEFYTLVP